QDADPVHLEHHPERGHADRQAGDADEQARELDRPQPHDDDGQAGHDTGHGQHEAGRLCGVAERLHVDLLGDRARAMQLVRVQHAPSCTLSCWRRSGPGLIRMRPDLLDATSRDRAASFAAVVDAPAAVAPAGTMLDRLERSAWAIPLPTRRLFILLAWLTAG